VGRSNRQAFAYFTYRADKQLQDDARKRLSAIRDFTQLGSGFKIAMRDLEIRGAGNLLGPEQHGHIAAVGFDLYCKLVNEAIEQGLGETQSAADKAADMKLDLGLNAYIPDDYIPETALKFEIYNKIAACRTGAESVLLKNELCDRFGEPPKATQNLFRLLTMRNLGQALELVSLMAPQQVLTLNFGAKNPFDGQALLDLSKKYGKRLRFSGKTELLFRLNLQNRGEDERLSEIEDFLRELVDLTAPKQKQAD
jgi:transcription-repair coupling factor (superfamily II helicase)